MESGDRCPRCPGRLQVVNTKVTRSARIRYLGCRGCGFRPAGNKVVVPIRYAPARSKPRCYQ